MSIARHQAPIVLLHVDDNEEDRFFLVHCLRKAAIPFDLRQLSTFVSATAYLKGEGAFADRVTHPLPAIVLLDSRLHGSTPLEPLAPLRAIPGCQHLVLIILTGSEDPGHVHRGYQSGAYHFFVKPIHTSDLTLILKTLHDCSFSLPPCYSALRTLEHYRHPPAASN